LLEMKLSEIGAAIAGLTAQVNAFIAGTRPASITVEQHAALTASATDLSAKLLALDTEFTEASAAASVAETASSTEIARLTAQVAVLTKNLSDRVALATAGAAAAAGLAAGQTVAAVAAGTDVDPAGKTPLQALQAKMAAETDPVKKTILARQARALRGVDFKNEEVKAIA
jgi:hypothetical protein